MGACAQPEQPDIIHLRWMGGGNYAHSGPQVWGQVLGLRPGQGRAGGTGTGLKQLSLFRMQGTIHGYTPHQVGC